MTHFEAQDIAAALHNMPAWADVTAGDTATLALIEAAIRRLDGADSDIIIYGIRRFVKECQQGTEGFNVSAMSKVFVLNRFLFDVPEFAPLDQPRFGGFVGVPVRDDFVNELWPWQVEENRHLRLSGFFRGYTGESFLAVEEAVAFRDHYGLRR